jgi:transcriptional regulator with XRE-family HTH domain
VRLAVREAREANGLTQADVAAAMEWSISKVMRIESGEVTVSPNDLRPLLDVLGVQDRDVVGDLTRAAKESKNRLQWWDEPRYREALTPATRTLIQYEAESVGVRHFCLALIPGRLQTNAYAQQLLSHYSGAVSAETLALRIDARSRRREQLLSRRDRTKIYLLLDESVLLRPVGSRQILGEQLAELGKHADEGWLAVRIIPFTFSPPMVGPFELLDLKDGAILYRESDIIDDIVEDLATVRWHRAIWDRIWEASIPNHESAGLLKRRAAELLTGPTQGPNIEE